MNTRLQDRSELCRLGRSSILHLAACTFLLCSLTSLSAATLTLPHAYSANREYSVTLSSANLGELQIEVFHHRRDSTTLAWTRKSDWHGVYAQRPASTPLWQIHALVTSGGDTVILRNSDTQIRDSNDALRLFCRDAKKDTSFHPFNLAEFSGNGPALPKISGVGFHSHRSLLDLLTPEEDEYAFWSAPSDRWFSVSLKDFSSGVVRDEDRIARLNRLGHQRAEELINEHQPSTLKKAVRAFKVRLAKIAPFLVSAARPVSFPSSDPSPAYLFVTARKRPADRRYIDGLLAFPYGSRDGYISARPGGFRSHVYPPELLLGDFLARRWDGDTNAIWHALPFAVQIPDEPLRSLGILRTSVELPFEQPKNPGSLRVYVIPAELGPDAWTTDTHRDRIWSGRFSLRDRRSSTWTGSLHAAIRGLRPGEYRLKILWERRPPPFLTLGPYQAKPGDYESAESAPFRIQAGQTLELPGLACTNRIGNDPTAYAADDAWAAESKGVRYSSDRTDF